MKIHESDARLQWLIRAVRGDPNDLAARREAVAMVSRLGRPLPRELFVWSGRESWSKDDGLPPSRDELVREYGSSMVSYAPGDACPIGARVRELPVAFANLDGTPRPPFTQSPSAMYRSPAVFSGRWLQGVVVGWDDRAVLSVNQQGCSSCTCEVVNDSVGYWKVELDDWKLEKFRYHVLPPWCWEPVDHAERVRLFREHGHYCETCEGWSYLPGSAPTTMRAMMSAGYSHRPCPDCVIETGRRRHEAEVAEEKAKESR